MRRNIFNMRILGVVLFLTITAAIIAAAIYPGGVKEVSAQGQSQVWCYEIVQHSDGTLSITGHQPPAIKNFPIGAGDKLKARCFASWADAASFLSGGKVQLPKNASEKDYEAATETLNVDNSHVLTVLSEP